MVAAPAVHEQKDLLRNGKAAAHPGQKALAPIGSLTVKISGMRCENCRRSVTAALDALDGVAAKVSLENGTARVSFERPLSDEELAQAVESAGFDVLEIRH